MTSRAATDSAAVSLVQSFSDSLALQQPHDPSVQALVTAVADDENQRHREEALKVDWRDLFIPSHPP